MSNFKNYNQKLLAIIGTLVLIGLSMLIIIGLYFFISETLITKSNRAIQDNSLTLNKTEGEKADAKKESINQEVTFENPKLIDSISKVYIIPISQVNIENTRNGNYEEPQLVSGGKLGYSRYKRNRYYRYRGEYNNIMLYNEPLDTQKYVFNNKIFIDEFRNIEIDSKHYLFITGSTNDSNKDNKLNESDLKSFYVYDISKNEVKEFNFDGHSFTNYHILFDSSKVILSYTVDKNKNGQINELQEPIIMKELNLLTFEILDFVKLEKIKELNELIN